MTYTLHCGDSLQFMRGMDAGSVDCIIADPPYFGVLDNAWDNAWKTRDEFIAWLGVFFDEFQRVLRFNGSLFVFAYPNMAAHVEVEIGKRFNVLNHLVWYKKNGGSASRNDKTALRAFIPQTERIIFAEHYGADNNAKGEAGYVSKCDELRGFVFEPLRKYLADEMIASGNTAASVNKAWRAKMGGNGGMASRWFTTSQWCLPTAENYAWLQDLFNGHLRREYEDLRREYEDLRREYEDLRREYEDLRRPFAITATDQYSDVWQFNTSANEGTLHPAQKPLALLRYMIRAATRNGATVLVPFLGSGTDVVAAIQLGRNFIGCEIDPGYFAIAQQRIADAAAQPALFQLDAPTRAEQDEMWT